MWLGACDANNRLTVDAVGAIDHYQAGLPFTVADKLAIVIDGVPAGSTRGLRVDANGKVCVASVAAITHYENGLPFASDGSLAVTAAGTRSYDNQGLSFDTNNRLITT
jgi:hypothetical protein